MESWLSAGSSASFKSRREIVIGYRNRSGRISVPKLHHNVTAPAPDFDKSVLGQNLADLASREPAKPTQLPGRSGWRRPLDEGGRWLRLRWRIPKTVRALTWGSL